MLLDSLFYWVGWVFSSCLLVIYLFYSFLDRGNCSFTEKTLNAQHAGAVGIIIADNSDEVIYPSMSGNNTGISK